MRQFHFGSNIAAAILTLTVRPYYSEYFYDIEKDTYAINMAWY